MTALEAVPAVSALLAEYCAHLDADRLEDWCGLFAEDGTYRIVPRENRVRNLPAAILHLGNKRMIRDRVTVLRTAAVYNIHVDRHIVSAIRVLKATPASAEYEANFCVYQSDQEGHTRLFCTGVYEGVVTLGAQPLVVRQEVIVDTFAIPALLAVPL